jgi:hypothetical protein
MQCQGKTKDGKPCTRKCQGKFCWQHSKKSVSKSPQRSPRLAQSKKANGDQQYRYCSCVSKIKAKQPGVNAFAICSKSVGRISNSCKQYEN